jgi:hypothetical protein
MKLKSKRGEPESASDGITLSFDKEPTAEEAEAAREAEQAKQQQARREQENKEMDKLRQARAAN